MDAVRLVLGIRRSARAVQHAGPAGPKARRGGSKVGGRRSTYDLRVCVRKQGVVSVVAEQWKMHARKSQQRMVQSGHVFLQGSIVRAALARLYCSALLAQLPFHPSHQARRCQMMLGAMQHHVQHLLQIGVHCDVHVVVLV